VSPRVNRGLVKAAADSRRQRSNIIVDSRTRPYPLQDLWPPERFLFARPESPADDCSVAGCRRSWQAMSGDDGMQRVVALKFRAARVSGLDFSRMTRS